MKQFNIEKGIQELKGITLSAQEKKVLFGRIRKDCPSPYQFGVFWKRQAVYAGMAVVIIGGTIGTSYAAEGAVPGDILYPVKVHINEPIRGAIVVTTEGKAQWASKKAERRLQEAQTLASEGKLDTKTRTEIQHQFEIHATELQEASKNLGKKNVQIEVNTNNGHQSRIRAQFKSDVGVQVNILQEIKSSSGDSVQNIEIDELKKHVEERVREIEDEQEEQEREIEQKKSEAKERIEKEVEEKRSEARTRANEARAEIKERSRETR